MKKSVISRLLAALLALCLLWPALAASETVAENDNWVSFLLICNEGMNNDKGNAGNTLMVVAMEPTAGQIRLMSFTWDTFIDYEGYDVPQKLDMPYRNNGPEEAMKVFNDNFDLGITYYMSLNYLNLASLIDEFGGVTIDISRAERNALNGMVGSKKKQLQEQVGTGLLSQAIVDMLAQEYYLTDFGPETHLNGLQAVGYGWLQYDSVYNCCVRDANVIAALFDSVGQDIAQKIAFYTNESGKPADKDIDGKRAINLDEMTDEDYEFLRLVMGPIFTMSFHNLPEEAISDISHALARVAYEAARQGLDIFGSGSLRHTVLPLEAQDPYDIVAGAQGHLVDKEANKAAIREFLFGD